MDGGEGSSGLFHSDVRIMCPIAKIPIQTIVLKLSDTRATADDPREVVVCASTLNPHEGISSRIGRPPTHHTFRIIANTKTYFKSFLLDNFANRIVLLLPHVRPPPVPTIIHSICMSGEWAEQRTTKGCLAPGAPFKSGRSLCPAEVGEWVF